MKKTNNPFKKNKFEIKYILIDTLVTSLISFFSALSVAKSVNFQVISISLLTAVLVGLYKLQDYIKAEKNEYCKGYLSFF